MNDCKNHVLRSQIDLYNWTDNHLNDIKQDMSSIRGVHLDIPQKNKRNASTIFNLSESDDKRQQVKQSINHRANKSMIFNSTQSNSIFAKPSRTNSLMNSSHDTKTISSISGHSNSNNAPKIMSLKKRINKGNITSTENPLMVSITSSKVKI